MKIEQSGRTNTGAHGTIAKQETALQKSGHPQENSPAVKVDINKETSGYSHGSVKTEKIATKL